MKKLGKKQLEDIANGSSLLASGGGSIKVAQMTIPKILEIKKSVELKSVDEVKDDEWGAMVACIGSPKAEIETGLHGASFRAFELLEKNMGKNFSHTFSVEAGPNMFLAMLTAVKKKIAIIDGDGAGRAVPTLEMLTYANAVSESVFTLASQTDKDIKAALYARHVKDIENMARPFIHLEKFNEIAGIAGWAMNGKTMQEKNAVIPGTITLSEKVGSTLRKASETGKDPVEALADFFDNRFFLLFHGEISEISETTAGGFDSGVVFLKNSETEISIVNQNENMIAWDNQKSCPIAMAPDLICYLTPEDTSLSNADIKKGKEIFLIGLKAEKRLRHQPMLKAFTEGLKNVGYYGKYIPIEELQT